MTKKVKVIHVHQLGFTLIELMIALVIVAIFAAIAIPSYQAYIHRADAAQAQQEMQKIAEQLSRHKVRNFNYKGFDASYLYKDSSGNLSTNFDANKQTVSLPLDSQNPKYILSIVGLYIDEKDITDPKDDVITSTLLTSTSTANLGTSWAIKAISTDPNNYDILLTSSGTRCMNKDDKTKVDYQNCGTSSEGAELW